MLAHLVGHNAAARAHASANHSAYWATCHRAHRRSAGRGTAHNLRLGVMMPVMTLHLRLGILMRLLAKHRQRNHQNRAQNRKTCKFSSVHRSSSRPFAGPSIAMPLAYQSDAPEKHFLRATPCAGAAARCTVKAM